MYNVGSLLAVYCIAAEVVLKKSEKPHKRTRQGLFTGYPIRAREMVGYYYGSQLYSKLGGQKKVKNTYGKGVMAGTVKPFLYWAFKITDRLVDGRGVEQTSLIVPSQFCCMQGIEDGRYLPEDKATDIVKRTHPR